MDELRSKLKDKKRVVVKIGSSSLQHPETGDLDYIKMDILVRELCNIRNQGLWQKGCPYFKARYDCRETGMCSNRTG